jgi:hypothetical protein
MGLRALRFGERAAGAATQGAARVRRTGQSRAPLAPRPSVGPEAI